MFKYIMPPKPYSQIKNLLTHCTNIEELYCCCQEPPPGVIPAIPLDLKLFNSAGFSDILNEFFVEIVDNYANYMPINLMDRVGQQGKLTFNKVKFFHNAVSGGNTEVRVGIYRLTAGGVYGDLSTYGNSTLVGETDPIVVPDLTPAGFLDLTFPNEITLETFSGPTENRYFLALKVDNIMGFKVVSDTNTLYDNYTYETDFDNPGSFNSTMFPSIFFESYTFYYLLWRDPLP